MGWINEIKNASKSRDTATLIKENINSRICNFWIFITVRIVTAHQCDG